jgi:putative ABC transport system permease protein
VSAAAGRSPALAGWLAGAWRIARRELRGGVSGFRVFLACLALGVAAIAAVGSVGSAIRAGLEREGSVILGGDAELTFTYRTAEADERAWMEERAERVSEIVEFRSMATIGEERALTQVKAVDDAYPLTGEMRLDPPMPLAEALEGFGAVVEPALASRMGLEVGDAFSLGTQDFTLSALIEREPDAAAGGFAFGPKTIVLRESLADSGLLVPGTLFDSAYRLLLPEGADLAALAADAEARFEGSGARFRDARQGAPGVTEFVTRLESFLILVGLAGLAVGGVGVSAAVRAYLGRKTATIATLRTLGAERRTVFAAYLMQIGVLTAIGVAMGVVLGALIPLAAAPILEARLPIPIASGIHPAPLAEAALYGVLTAFLFALIPLARTEEVRPAALFRDAMGAVSALPRRRYLVAGGVILALLVGFAALFSEVPELALYTAAAVAGALLVLTGAAWLVTRLARASSGARALHGRTALRLAVGSVGGPRAEAGAVVLSLGLGLTVLAAVGQIDRNLRDSIAEELPEVAPSYFFVDIQTDQLEGFYDRVEGDPGVSRVEGAPMLRGVITEIGGRPAAEVAGEHWTLQGDRGVTYAQTPPEGTEITEGAWWPEGYDGPPLVSFADEEARELGLEIGSEITVNILGRDIVAEIASFREVTFETAGIGFIMLMNPGALAAAPHTHIATVYAEEEAEAAILRDLAADYPNITAIRVKDAIDRVSEVLDGLAAAIRYGASITLLTGFVVLIGAAAAGEGARVYEAAVLKTLGASRATILASFALRSGLMGAAAGLVALAAGCLGAWAVVTFVMESSYDVAWGNALAVVLGGIAATLGAGMLFAWRPLAARPAQVLRARE